MQNAIINNDEKQLTYIATDMMAELGAWHGLQYDVTGIKRKRDQSNERAHPDAPSDDG